MRFPSTWTIVTGVLAGTYSPCDMIRKRPWVSSIYVQRPARLLAVLVGEPPRAQADASALVSSSHVGRRHAHFVSPIIACLTVSPPHVVWAGLYRWTSFTWAGRSRCGSAHIAPGLPASGRPRSHVIRLLLTHRQAAVVLGSGTQAGEKVFDKGYLKRRSPSGGQEGFRESHGLLRQRSRR